MPLLHRDRGRRGPLSVLAAAGILLCLLPAHAASDKREAIVLRRSTNPAFDLNNGTVSAANVELVQGSTLLKASKADATGWVDGKYENSTWKLTGDVHLEFNGAKLDTQSATVVFADGRLDTIKVQPAPAQAAQQKKSPVHLEMKGAVLDAQTATVAFADGRMRNVQTQGAQGLPAQFSHQFKTSSKRVHGRAGRIDYDVAEDLMRFSGGTWYALGNTEMETQVATYSFSTGVFKADGEAQAILRSEERVPAPSTPNRATAK
ncbi:MAG: LptA/OstA family protein [Steroidobacteraceae bacterium]